MAYPTELLQDSEEIVLERHPHWTFMLGPVVMVAMSFTAFLILSVYTPFWWVGAVIVLMSILGGVAQFLTWQTIEFVVTTERVIVRRGIFAKSGIEIPLDRIMNISYRQSLFERIVGAGDLVIESAGESGRQQFTDVAHPAQVQNLIYGQTETYEDSRMGPRRTDGMGDVLSAPHQASIPDQIEKLAHLRDRGILSEAEFQEKKQELLDRL